MKSKILVVNGPENARAIEDLANIADFVFDTNEFMKNPDKYKLVMFTGGADVSPSLYGHTSPKRMCGTNAVRDAQEVAIFELALECGIPMTGICRGSQLLNVMCGGVMMHHITNHGISGTHTMLSNTSEEVIEVTSTHHQMSVPSVEGYIIGWAAPKLSTVFFGDKDEVVNYNGPEVESIYYPKHKVFAVQFHPEYMPKESAGYKWYNQGVKDLLSLTEKEFSNKYLSLKNTDVTA